MAIRNGCKPTVAARESYGWSGPMFAFAHLYNVQRWAARRSVVCGLEAQDQSRTASSPDSPLCRRGSGQVSVTAARQPAGPYEMKWVMLHRRGQAPVQTQIVSLIEPYVDTPSVVAARPLATFWKRRARLCGPRLHGRVSRPY